MTRRLPLTVLGVVVLGLFGPLDVDAQGGRGHHGGVYGRGSGWGWGYGSGYISGPICSAGPSTRPAGDPYKVLEFDGADVGLPGFTCTGRRGKDWYDRQLEQVRRERRP